MNCRFIHPGFNDKGNYSLISKPDPFSPNGAPPGGPLPLIPNNPWVRRSSTAPTSISGITVCLTACEPETINECFHVAGRSCGGGTPPSAPAGGTSCGERLGARAEARQRGNTVIQHRVTGSVASGLCSDQITLVLVLLGSVQIIHTS